MVLLDPKSYYKALTLLDGVTINTLFAKAVIENTVDGKIYADTKENPSSFIVWHPYGMSLLYGNTGNPEFNAALIKYMLNTKKVRGKYEWMQAFPGIWNEKIETLIGKQLIPYSVNLSAYNKQKVEVNTRVNFMFNPDRFANYKSTSKVHDFSIVRTTEEMFESIKGSVIPKHFWRTPLQFCENGIGFSLMHNDIAVSTAYSAFIMDGKLELGIETLEKYRGNGFAEFVCSRLIDYCIENSFEPIWSCRRENVGSHKLAQKLGFVPTISLPFYRLPY